MRSMDEGQARFWDILLKAIAGLAAALAWIWSVHQYRDSQRERDATLRLQLETLKAQIEAQRLQAHQSFLSRQLEVYAGLSEAAARAAEAQNDTDRQKALHAFNIIANGPLKLVSADSVNTAAWQFYDCFHNKHCEDGDYVHYARKVARACRASTQNYWEIPLPELQDEHPLMLSTAQRTARP